jgi:hypothetical protein
LLAADRDLAGNLHEMSAAVCSITLHVRVPSYVYAVLGVAIIAARCGLRFDPDKLAIWAANRVKVSTRPK